MEQTNGYIRLAVSGGRAYLKLYPAVEGGESVSLKEAEFYLMQQGFSSYDKDELREIIRQGSGVMALEKVQVPFYSEMMVTRLSENRMESVSRFYPPSVGGMRLTVQDVMESMKQDGVKYGIDEEKVQAFIEHPVYYQDVSLASGTPMKPGFDAFVEYFFNISPDRKPAYNEDGSVDYHNLSLLNDIFEGDLLARLHQARPGEAGYDLTGKMISPPPVKKGRLEAGRNIRLSGDETEAYSEVTGHVELIGNRMFVSAVYEIPGDVGVATGDISYSGDVHVGGSVRGGFSIICDGDIIVEGEVEDALLDAGGSIIVKHGLHGKEKGVLQAGKNVICKFIENGKVFAGGYVESGSAINCEIMAKGDVNIKSKKGLIAGSVIRTTGSISARTIGTESESKATVEAGVDVEAKERLAFLLKEIEKTEEKIKDLMPMLATYQRMLKSGMKIDPKKMENFQKVGLEMSDYQNLLKADIEESEALKEHLSSMITEKIHVEKDAYPGVNLTISSFQRVLDKRFSNCVFTAEDGEIMAVTT